MRDKDSGDTLLDRMMKYKNNDEAAGYIAVALGLMGFQEAKEDINQLIEKATRRPQLLTQCSIALGLLGDKDIGLKLIGQMKEQNPVAVFSALAQALGFIGDRRVIASLVELLGDKSLQPVNRAFAAVALGLVGDKELMPWNSKISININYRANVETLTGGGTGILDIL
jgi:HEAT repeat protein